MTPTMTYFFWLEAQRARVAARLVMIRLLQVCSVDFERVSSVSQIMNIHASMEFDGLGPRRCLLMRAPLSPCSARAL